MSADQTPAGRSQLDAPSKRWTARPIAASSGIAQAAATWGVPSIHATDAFIEAEKAGLRLFWSIDGHANAARLRVCWRESEKVTGPRAPAAGGESWRRASPPLPTHREARERRAQEKWTL